MQIILKYAEKHFSFFGLGVSEKSSIFANEIVNNTKANE
jgi:hypothetical protein